MSTRSILRDAPASKPLTGGLAELWACLPLAAHPIPTRMCMRCC